MEMEFSNFLAKMGNETGSSRKPKVEERQPQRKPAPQKRVVEEEQDYAEIPTREPIREERREERNSINEEFLDKAYDYAQGVIKVIRSNFKSTEERVAMLESLQKSIGMYLQNIGVQPTYTPPRNESTSNGGGMMTEKEWNNMSTINYDQIPGSVRMNNLTGQEVRAQPQQPSGNVYNPRLNLGIKINSEGKQEADLSGVTQRDINEMRELAGIVGPEAERKKQERAISAPAKPQLSQDALDEIAQATREG